MSTPSPSKGLPAAVLERAETNLRDILELAVEHHGGAQALVVWDERCELARALYGAYRRVLPGARSIEFEREDPAQVRVALESLAPGDLAVLIQSTSFRLDAFRIRLELFKRSIKVIEHPHLARMHGPQAEIYIDALAYDRDYYRDVGQALKLRIDRAQVTCVDTGDEQLIYPAGLEPAKLNVGDYRELRDIGGQFPIGEVFTESRDLEAVHGRLRIAFFGDRNFTVNRPPHPITLVIERGRVVAARDSTPEFDAVLAGVRADEGQVWVRELGFGLNRALTPERVVDDIGTFERMCGVHLSLGAKHASYNKPGIAKRSARHHVDVFAATQGVSIDGEQLFAAGAWSVPF